MAEVFRNFITGYGAGQEMAQQRRQQNALSHAGQLYGAGQYDQAENALIAAGMPQEAASYSALGEARRLRTLRNTAAQRMRGAGSDASAQLRAGAQAYLEGGDVEQFSQLQQTANAMSDRDRQLAAERSDWMARTALALDDPSIPVEQRAARAQQLLASSPYAQDDQMAAMVANNQNWDSPTLQSVAQSAMSVADIFTRRDRAEDVAYRNERTQVEDDRWRREFDAQERARRTSEAQGWAQLETARENRDHPRPDQTTIRQGRAVFNAMDRAEDAIRNYREALRAYGTPEMLRVGENAAALEAAHRRMAILLKGDQFLDLGALVGADFQILGDVVGEPGNIVSTVRSGGRAGLERRLQEVESIVRDGRSAAERQYGDMQSHIPNFRPDQGATIEDRAAALGAEVGGRPAAPAANVQASPYTTRPVQAVAPTAAPRSAAAPPSAAIADLRRDPSPAAQREFDQIFGAGAAARALGQQRGAAETAALHGGLR